MSTQTDASVFHDKLVIWFISRFGRSSSSCQVVDKLFGIMCSHVSGVVHVYQKCDYRSRQSCLMFDQFLLNFLDDFRTFFMVIVAAVYDILNIVHQGVKLIELYAHSFVNCICLMIVWSHLSILYTYRVLCASMCRRPAVLGLHPCFISSPIPRMQSEGA